jgi:hypothetical protein
MNGRKCTSPRTRKVVPDSRSLLIMLLVKESLDLEYQQGVHENSKLIDLGIKNFY